MVPDPESPQGEATRLLRALAPGRGGAGDGPEAERLWELVYDTLRGLANRMLASERAGHTLQPTALANEAYMRLIQQDEVQWQDRAHFLGVATQVMRRLLVDWARGHDAAKRGGGWQRVTLVDDVLAGPASSLDILALDQAMTRLAAEDARAARVAELRMLGGLSVKETSEVLGIATRTVEKDWTLARLWLARALADEPGA